CRWSWGCCRARLPTADGRSTGWLPDGSRRFARLPQLFEVLVLVSRPDGPQIVGLAEQIPRRQHAHDHPVSLRVVDVRAVTPDGLQGLETREMTANDAQRPFIVLVVNRIRLGDAHDHGIDDAARVNQLDLAQFGFRKRDELIVGSRPEVVADRAEVLEAETGLRRI